MEFNQCIACSERMLDKGGFVINRPSLWEGNDDDLYCICDSCIKNLAGRIPKTTAGSK